MMLAYMRNILYTATLTYVRDLCAFYREEAVRGVISVSILVGYVCLFLVIVTVEQERAIRGRFEAAALRQYRLARTRRITLCLAYIIAFQALIYPVLYVDCEISTPILAKILIVILAFCALRDLLHLEAGPAALFQICFNVLGLAALFCSGLKYEETNAVCVGTFALVSLISAIYYYNTGNLLAQKYLGIKAIRELDFKTSET